MMRVLVTIAFGFVPMGLYAISLKFGDEVAFYASLGLLFAGLAYICPAWERN